MNIIYFIKFVLCNVTLFLDVCMLFCNGHVPTYTT